MGQVLQVFIKINVVITMEAISCAYSSNRMFCARNSMLFLTTIMVSKIISMSNIFKHKYPGGAFQNIMMEVKISFIRVHLRDTQIVSNESFCNGHYNVLNKFLRFDYIAPSVNENDW